MGHAKSFMVPDGMKMNAQTIRRMLRSSGPQDFHLATMPLSATWHLPVRPRYLDSGAVRYPRAPENA
jgi:hypothetical protein